MTVVSKRRSAICLATKIAIIQARVETSVTMVDDYVSVDQEAITSESLTDDEMVESVKFSGSES